MPEESVPNIALTPRDMPILHSSSYIGGMPWEMASPTPVLVKAEIYASVSYVVKIDGGEEKFCAANTKFAIDQEARSVVVTVKATGLLEVRIWEVKALTAAEPVPSPVEIKEDPKSEQRTKRQG